jgi:hypothetical protein
MAIEVNRLYLELDPRLFAAGVWQTRYMFSVIIVRLVDPAALVLQAKPI